jgi:inorganic pyrophosphatase/exopolyphosphatase
MDKIVVTTGAMFADIDAFACVIAYTEMLKKEGKNAVAYIQGELNNSITPDLRDFDYVKVLPDGEYKFVVLDVSDPKKFPKEVEPNKVIEIYDHHDHYGNKDFWLDKLRENAHIEMIGACATFVWEEYKKRGFSEDVEPETAYLLAAAIISNTLNFNASVTDERDKKAFMELEEKLDIRGDWEERYFKAQEEELYKDPYKAIVNDTKIERLDGMDYPIVIGQLEMWDSTDFIKENLESIEKALLSFGYDDWFLTAPCIKKGHNNFVTRSAKIKELLKERIGAEFTGDIGKNNRLLLRKEILMLIKENL